LAKGNLLAPMAGLETPELSWRDGPVTFTVAELSAGR
jgi:hypothetical protein